MYYVYIHKDKKTNEIVYCGKGSNSRYRGYESRSVEHLALMKNQKLDFIILDYFNDENDAYIYEEKITEQYKMINQCKFNKSIGRRTSEETKIKLSVILKGMTRSEETKQRIKKNHSRPLAKEVKMYKDGVFIKSFRSSREAGIYASSNGICSFGWCGRSLKTGELTKSTYEFPNGGYLFSYQDAKMQLRKDQ
ncbi:MAG: hypothetical protein WBB47_15740 [Paenisporosarcina sp.]